MVGLKRKVPNDTTRGGGVLVTWGGKEGKGTSVKKGSAKKESRTPRLRKQNLPCDL